jgi:hypothetical protein
LVVWALAGGASAADLALLTAGEQGTYYHFGQDLRRLLKPHGLNITIHSSNGAAENARALLERADVQLGIVQSDVVTAITDQPASLAMRTVADGMRLVFPLFDEDVHIVARAGITDVSGLAGRRVAIGREGSGTYVTAITLVQLAKIAPGALIAMDGPEAVDSLRAGLIDAMVAVAGRPVRLLREAVKSSDRLSLVPITTPAILEAYTATEIPARTYPWQPTAVRTVAVKALLLTYDPDRRHCEIIGRFAQHVVAGLGWLAKNGHPYWKRVDIEQPVKGWQQYDCVSQYASKPFGADSPAASTPGARD